MVSTPSLLMAVFAPLQASVFPSSHWAKEPLAPWLLCPYLAQSSLSICAHEPQLWPHAPALCPQEPAFGMLTVPLKTPLLRLPAECHAEAVSVFKLVSVRPGHLRRP